METRGHSPQRHREHRGARNCDVGRMTPPGEVPSQALSLAKTQRPPREIRSFPVNEFGRLNLSRPLRTMRLGEKQFFRFPSPPSPPRLRVSQSGLFPERFQCRFRLRCPVQDFVQRAARKIPALRAGGERPRPGALADFAQLLAIIRLHSRRRAARAVDVLRLVRGVVPPGPLRRHLRPQGGSVLLRGDERLCSHSSPEQPVIMILQSKSGCRLEARFGVDSQEGLVLCNYHSGFCPMNFLMTPRKAIKERGNHTMLLITHTV